MKIAIIIISALISAGSLASFSSKIYTCSVNDLREEITITTNMNAVGDITSDYFTISSPGLFSEFDNLDFDLSVCAYDGMYGDEKLSTGMHCEGQSIGGGFDFKSIFKIQSNEKNLGNNPKTFKATITNGAKKYSLECK